MCFQKYFFQLAQDINKLEQILHKIQLDISSDCLILKNKAKTFESKKNKLSSLYYFERKSVLRN